MLVVYIYLCILSISAIQLANKVVCENSPHRHERKIIEKGLKVSKKGIIIKCEKRFVTLCV